MIFVSAIVEDEISDERILNVDQTPSKFVPTDNDGRKEFKACIQKRKGRILTLDPFMPYFVWLPCVFIAGNKEQILLLDKFAS